MMVRRTDGQTDGRMAGWVVERIYRSSLNLNLHAPVVRTSSAHEEPRSHKNEMLT